MTRPLIIDTLRTVKKNFSRFISILLIVALGTAFFTGIKAAAPDMFSTAEQYFKDYNLMDIRVQSSIGLTDTDIAALSETEGVEYVAGEKFVDAFVSVNGNPELDIDGTRITTRVYSVSPEDIRSFVYSVNDGNYINRLQLIEGRFPQSKGECLVDASRLSTPETYKLGSVITLTNAGEESPEELNTDRFTIVGIIRSPYYLSFERGNTNIGSGKLGTFIVVPEEAFSTDYYSEVYIKVSGADAYAPFSDAYFTYVDKYVKEIEERSPSLIANRVNTLRPELAQRIANAEKEISDKEREAAEGLQELNAGIATLQNLVDNGEEILANAQKEFTEKFSEIEGSISAGEAAYNRALENYSEMRRTLASRRSEYEMKEAELQANSAAYDSALAEYTESNNRVGSLREVINNTSSLINAATNVINQIGDTQVEAFSNEQLQSFITIMQTTYPELYNSISALTSQGLAREIISYLSPYLESQKAQLASQQRELDEAQALLNAQKTILDQKKVELEAAVNQSAAAKQELDQAETDLQNYADTLNRQGINIQNSTLEVALQKLQAENEIKELQTQISAAPERLRQALSQKEEIETQLETSLSFAKSQLGDAKNLYEKLDTVKWSIYDRNDTPGYSSYGQSVENIEVISNIFPIFFFIISSLVCLTTVTRLVDEDRTLIGTYKALGYTNGAISFKYVAYSLTAGVLGSILGIGIAYWLFPYIINSAYSIMYSLPALNLNFPVLWALIGFAIGLGSTALVTLIAVLGALRLKPSVLMRPKAPKKGKRILIEHIPFIWRKLSFTLKVTLRNLFRNKSRFFMTLVGIAGCTALLLGSLGFYNSISAIKARQYDDDDAISKFDLQVVFDNAQPAPIHSAEFTAVAADARISSMSLISMRSMIGSSDRTDESLETYVLVPEIPEKLGDYFDLRSRVGDMRYTLDDSGAIITEKLAKATNTNVGDEIRFTDAVGNTYSVPVSAIAENYTFHYIFLSPALYKEAVGSAPVYSYAIGNITESLKASKGVELNSLKGLLATDFMRLDGITTVAFTSETTKSIGEITNALSLVIAVFFITALILAFVVLYNLANINIIERTRELATLKVLGFNEGEVSKYVLRENVTVSFFGIVLGILLGLGLHRLLITFTAIDTVMYGQSVYLWSYAVAVGITVLFIAGVNLLLRRKTKRIDMVESLKSVE